MSTMRAVIRAMPARVRLPGDVDRSAMLRVLALCAVLFVGCFALSRATSPSTRSAQGATPRVVAARIPDQVPLRLAAAPALQPGVRVAPKPARPTAANTRTGALSQSPVQSVTPASTPVVTSTAPAASVPASTTPAAAPEPAKAPAPRQSSPPPRKPSGGGGTSFDSSG